MSDPQPSLQIDTDWKKQAQEEKRRLAEQQKQKEAAAATSAPPSAPSGSAPTAQRSRELPPASLQSLVQGIVTQTLYHLGDLAVRGGESNVNLDLAKHHIDSLAVLEAKTKGNLTPDEQRMLDAALYEVRMRYVNVASQYIT